MLLSILDVTTKLLGILKLELLQMLAQFEPN